MPFGKYGPKGEKLIMQDVPVGYLHFLWMQGMHKETRPVANYIRRNLNALKKEDSDLIW